MIQYNGIHLEVKKRILKIYGNTKRMEPSGLTSQIFKFYKFRNYAKQLDQLLQLRKLYLFFFFGKLKLKILLILFNELLKHERDLKI